MVGGVLSVVLLSWLFGRAKPHAVPVSIRPQRAALSALQPQAASIVDPTADALAEVRAHAHEVKKLLRQSVDVEAGLRSAIDLARSAVSAEDGGEDGGEDVDDEPQAAISSALPRAKSCPDGCTKHGNWSARAPTERTPRPCRSMPQRCNGL